VTPPDPFPEWEDLITPEHVERAREYAEARGRPAEEKKTKPKTRKEVRKCP
jgi:hypothetical protein